MEGGRMNRDAGSVGVVDAEHLVEGHSWDLELAADLDGRDGEGPGGDLQVGRLAVDAEQFGGLGHRGAARRAPSERPVTWTVRRLEPGYRLVRRHPTRPDTGSLGDAMMPGVVYRGVYIESDVCRAADVLDHHDLALCDDIPCP